MVRHEELLIHGSFVGGPCDSSVAKNVSHSAWNGSVVGITPEIDATWLEACLESAQETYLAGPWAPREERRALLIRAAELLETKTEDFAHLMALEIGKPVALGRAEVARGVITLRLSAQTLDRPAETSPDLSFDARSANYRAVVRQVPVGPVLAIAPYNWPINLALHKIGPALAAGCPVILKGASSAALCTLALARLLQEAGLPPGALNTAQGPASLAEKAAVDPRVRKVSFTGSPAVGWRLKQLLPKKRVTLELGSTSTAVILPDADLERVLATLPGSAFGYAGQVCISAQNTFIPRSRASEFCDALVKAALQFPTGNPQDEEVRCGPLISVRAADEVHQKLQNSGGQILAGGQRDQALLQPTLVWEPDPLSRLVTEEVFGPVLNVLLYDDFAEPIQHLQRSPYAIHHAIFGNDEAQIARLTKEVPSAGWVINDVPSVRFDALPYGGIKESGFGREAPPYAFDDYCEWQTEVRYLGPR